MINIRKPDFQYVYINIHNIEYSLSSYNSLKLYIFMNNCAIGSVFALFKEFFLQSIENISLYKSQLSLLSEK